MLKRAHIVRLAAAGKGDVAIVDALGVGTVTIWWTWIRFAEGGLDRTVYEKPRPGAVRVLEGVAKGAGMR